MKIRLNQDMPVAGVSAKAGDVITATLANYDELFALTLTNKATDVSDSDSLVAGSLGLVAVDVAARIGARGISMTRGVFPAGQPANTPLGRILTSLVGAVSVADDAGGVIALSGRTIIPGAAPIVAGQIYKVVVTVGSVLHTFVIAGAVPAGSTGGGTTPPTPVARYFGMNLAGTDYYSGVRMFSNLARAHIPQMKAAGNGLAQSQNLPYSYTDQTTGRVTVPSNEIYVFLVHPSNLADRVRVRWIGTSVATVDTTTDGNGQPLISGITTGTEGAYNYIEFQVLSRVNYPSIKLSAGYVDFFDAREANRSLSEKFDPAFVADCALLGRERFMDWQQTNQTTLLPITDAYRPKPSHIFKCQDWGYSYEEAIELSRAAGTDAYVCNPYMADQSYLNGLVTYAGQRLLAANNLYVETSNEPWNPGFLAYSKMRDDWRASNGTTSPGDPNGPQDTYAQQVATTVKQNTWIEAKAAQLGLTVGKTGRIRRCLNAQFGAGPNLAILLARPGLTDHCDIVVAAPYLANNNNTWQPGYTTADIPTMLELLTTADDGIDAQVRRILAMKAQVEAAGFIWDVYECGSHIITGETMVAIAFHRDPRLRPIYSYYLREIRKAAPNATFTIFNDFGASSIYGSWGHRDSQRDTTSPRYLALLDAINGIYTVPAIGIVGTPTAGTTGTPYSYQVKKYWGAGVDAPTAYSISAGALPTGLSINPTTGLITGTPTAAGTTNFTIRAEDSSGVITKAVSITIAAGISYTYYDDVRSVGTLPKTGAGSSRTVARGWSKDFGYASNGSVKADTDSYAWIGAYFGTGINSKDREFLVDVDMRTWTENSGGSPLVIIPVALDGGVADSELALNCQFGPNQQGLIQLTKGGGYFANLGFFPELIGQQVSFLVSIVAGVLKIKANGNALGDSNGYNVGTAYNANQRAQMHYDTNDIEKPIYTRIGLRAL